MSRDFDASRRLSSCVRLETADMFGDGNAVTGFRY